MADNKPIEKFVPVVYSRIIAEINLNPYDTYEEAYEAGVKVLSTGIKDHGWTQDELAFFKIEKRYYAAELFVRPKTQA